MIRGDDAWEVFSWSDSGPSTQNGGKLDFIWRQKQLDMRAFGLTVLQAVYLRRFGLDKLGVSGVSSS